MVSREEEGIGKKVVEGGSWSSRIGTIRWVKEEDRIEKKKDLRKATKTTMTNVSYQCFKSYSYIFSAV